MRWIWRWKVRDALRAFEALLIREAIDHLHRERVLYWLSAPHSDPKPPLPEIPEILT